MLEKYFDINPEINDAIKQGKPVVALESTIISHGMPYPENVKTARETEKIIRKKGAIPATIAILNGIIKVGLSDEELEFFGKSDNVQKVSRRDIPVVVAKKQHGATTVAATMIIAQRVGIKIFVTGGIGGVHRNAQETFDISADMSELSRTNVVVVCAGIKSILDLGLTLEYLETQGVPVIGYKTDDLPAFYTRKSGYKLVHSSNDVNELAKIFKAKDDINISGGTVIANPIPEEFAMDDDFIASAIEAALERANKNGVNGKATTPFLLSEIKKITKGKSLTSNIQLVYNNARVGADLAVALAKL